MIFGRSNRGLKCKRNGFIHNISKGVIINSRLGTSSPTDKVLKYSKNNAENPNESGEESSQASAESPPRNHSTVSDSENEGTRETGPYSKE